MTTTTISPLKMTPFERLQGRFLRAPDHPGEEGEEPLDDGEEGDDNDDEPASEDDAEGDDPEADDQDGDDPDGGRSKRGRTSGERRRIDTLTRRLREAEEKLRNRGGDDKAPQPPKKPTVDEFDTYEEYVEALTDFKAEQKANEVLSRAEQAREQRSAEKQFNNELARGKKAYKDWDDVVTEDVTVTRPMVSAIRDSDNPADVMYYLGSNPDEADRISELPAGKQANAIAKIDARFDRLKANSKSKDKEDTPLRNVSKAPEPIKPLGGGSSSVKKDIEKMSADEYIRSRNAELRKRKG